MIPFTAVYFLFGKDSEAKKLKYHTMLHRMAVFFLQRLPGIGFRMEKPESETFGKPAVIVANHQSHFDLVCMMALTPKIVFLTNFSAAPLKLSPPRADFT